MTPTGVFSGHLLRCVLTLLFALTTFFLSGQKDALNKANEAFNEDKYREALVYYNRIDGVEKSGPLLFKRGICQYELNELDLAMADFQRAYEYGYKNPDIDLYTGKIRHNKGAFTEAAEYYKKYLEQTPIESADRVRVRQLIKQCGRAVDLSYFKPIAIIERAPQGINTVFDDIAMVASPTVEGKYYFTSNRPNTSLSMDASDYDIYSIAQEGVTWTAPRRLPYAINRSKEDILIGFTQRADGLIMYRGEKYEGDIAVNAGSGENKTTKSMGLPSKFDYQTSDVYFFDDNLVLFSAKGTDTYGGYDLYYTKKVDNKWTDAKNLGPDINGPFDEVSPYLSADGSELYFSSNRDESIGAHDIFVSPYLYEAERWSAPLNLGIPINSPGDDINFELSYDGLVATLSSNRKTGYGGLDIFFARFKSPRGQQEYGSNYLPFADYRIVMSDEVVTIAENEAVLTEEDPGEVIDSIETSIEETAPISIEETSVTTPVIVTEQPAIETKSEPQTTDEEVVVETTPEQPTPPADTIIEEHIVSKSVPIVEVEKEKPTTITSPKTKSASSQQVTSGEAFTWQPLYYTTGKEILEKDNLNQITDVATYLENNPDVSVDIICHSGNDGILEFKLFSAIKLAERTQEFLEEKGISRRRISVRSYADNYPQAKTTDKGGSLGMADKYNARVEFNFYNTGKLQPNTERIEPPIPDYSYDMRHDIFHAITDDAVAYKIQIATVSQMYRGMALDLFNDGSVEVDPATGLYLYTIGLYDNYAEALLTKREVERFGLTDAKILPYYDGRRLSDDKLVYYVNEFPDLQSLMNYGN